MSSNRDISPTETGQKIIDIFAEHLAIDVDDPEVDLIEEGLLDSLAVVDLLMQLELNFGITVEMETLDLDDLRTVQSIEEFVSRNQK